MRSYFKVYLVTAPDGGLRVTNDESLGELMAMEMKNKEDTMFNFNAFADAFGEFASVRFYTQADLDAYQQCIIDNGPPTCVLTESQSKTGVELAGLLSTAFFNFVPYSIHPEN